MHTAEDAGNVALALFARRVAHDLNNAVTIVRSYSELLMSDLEPGSTALTDAAEIHEAAAAMTEYLRRISRFARAELARSVPVTVEQTLAELVVALQREEPGAPVFLDGAIQGVVETDPAWLGDSVRELLRNAREASPPDRPVIVRLGTERASAPSSITWAVIRVVDEGPGFDPSVEANAEDPFVTTKGTRGAGFGLTIAAAYARCAGGRLVRERDPDGGRTQVALWLPMDAGEHAGTATTTS